MGAEANRKPAPPSGDPMVGCPSHKEPSCDGASAPKESVRTDSVTRSSARFPAGLLHLGRVDGVPTPSRIARLPYIRPSPPTEARDKAWPAARRKGPFCPVRGNCLLYDGSRFL
ncbi:hypothetical protein MRX96_019454 [Rhipicephalus microplus]